MSNSDGLVEKEELIRSGWRDRQINAALDEADEFGPSGHWLNITGKPYYDVGRVEIASYRIGLSSKKPNTPLWLKWENSVKPTSIPVLAFDFHYLANKCKPGSSREFWSLRLSHPIIGRQPGTYSKERKLIEEVLIKLVERATDLNFSSYRKLKNYLSQRSDTALQSLESFWGNDVVVRPARRSSYLSKGKSKAFMNRSIDALALVHAGIVKDYREQPLNIAEMLIRSPRIRFDRKSLGMP
jgi:hypothetical protein